MKTIKLPSGLLMPVIGLGTWQATPEVIENAVLTALSVGYRLIDTAYNYGNEEAIGRTLEKWFSNGGKREELFITTKLPNFANRPSDVSKYLTESLQKLRLEYIDLYLIHHPFGFLEPPTGVTPPNIDVDTNHISIWKALENEVKAGKVRNIGVSNFNVAQIKRLCDEVETVPANVQVEIHAFLQQRELLSFCKEKGISVTAYAPLGSPSATIHFKKKYDFTAHEVPNPLLDEKVLNIASKLGKTTAQILLKFLIQLGIAVVPKSSSKERITENFQILDFELEESDMETLKTLDRGEDGRIFDFLFYKGIENHPEYPFRQPVKT